MPKPSLSPPADHQRDGRQAVQGKTNPANDEQEHHLLKPDNPQLTPALGNRPGDIAKQS
jgi:hypothetical protein